MIIFTLFQRSENCKSPDFLLWNYQARQLAWHEASVVFGLSFFRVSFIPLIHLTGTNLQVLVWHSRGSNSPVTVFEMDTVTELLRLSILGTT